MSKKITICTALFICTLAGIIWLFSYALLLESARRVSPAYGDMRYIRTGLELYHADYDEYPMPTSENKVPEIITTYKDHISTLPFDRYGLENGETYFYFRPSKDIYILQSRGVDRDLDFDFSGLVLNDNLTSSDLKILINENTYNSSDGLRSSGDLIRSSLLE